VPKDNKDDGDEQRNKVHPIPGVPWSLDFGIIQDSEGNNWVSIHIYTHTGLMVLFADPAFSESASNMWHSTAVKAKHFSPGPQLVVPSMDVEATMRQMREGQEKGE
jgi:hypothetical protein